MSGDRVVAQTGSDVTTSHVDELLLLRVSHLGQTVVVATQVVLQSRQGVNHHSFHFPTLCPGAGGRQTEPTDATARPHSGRQHIALIKLAGLELQWRRKRSLPVSEGSDSSHLAGAV